MFLLYNKLKIKSKIKQNFTKKRVNFNSILPKEIWNSFNWSIEIFQ
jgi:hypothetical protein